MARPRCSTQYWAALAGAWDTSRRVAVGGFRPANAPDRDALARARGGPGPRAAAPGAAAPARLAERARRREPRERRAAQGRRSPPDRRAADARRSRRHRANRARRAGHGPEERGRLPVRAVGGARAAAPRTPARDCAPAVARTF